MSLIANRYQIIKKLGAGAMGVVYLVHDKLRNQQVALKQVLMSDDTQRLAITREFRTLSTLRHPNIVSVIEYGFHERQPYFTMDYLPNAISFNSVGDNKIDVIIQVLQALDYLHRRGILHRDLKPANVLINDVGAVKVLDFGLARDSKRNKSGSLAGIVGTLNYIAPEVLNEEAQTIESDLWAVGVMLCEILTGHHPFDTGSPMKLIMSLNQGSANLSGVDDPFTDIVQKLLAKDPSQRYQNAHQVIQALYEALDIAPSESQAHRESFIQFATFVGREKEYQILVDALNTVRNNSSQLYLIGAEAGAGKSRLLDEIRTQALVEGFVVLQGQAVEGGGLPYQLWRDIARKLVLGAPINDITASVLKDLVPDIDTLLERKIADIAQLDPQGNRDRLMRALLERLQLLDAPILVILEDCHWASESLEMLKLLRPYCNAMPILFVSSYRHDERHDLPEEFPDAQIIKLDRLSPDDIAQLTTSMLGEETASPELIQRLSSETDGNALFMVEVVRVLAEQAGSLSKISNQTLPSSIFAGGMMAVLQRRLNKVPAWALKALQFSAVIGRKIDADLLRQLGISNLENWLQVCSDAFVLETYQGEWRFPHDRLRDVILQDIPDLPTFHQQVATAIEAVYPDNVDYAEALVEHWHLAGNPEKEVSYILKATYYFIQITAEYARAINLLMRALTYQLPDTLARIYRYLGEIEFFHGNYAKALYFSQLALDAHPQPSDHARILANRGFNFMRQGKYKEGLEVTQQGLMIAEKYDDKNMLVICYNLLGMLVRLMGDNATSMMYVEKALLMVKETDEAWGVAGTLGTAGLLKISVGDFASARSYYEQALKLRHENGDRWGTASNLINLAELTHFEGDFHSAQALYLESLSILQQQKDNDMIIFGLTGIVMTCVQLADYATARDYLVQVLRIVIKNDVTPMMYVVLLAAGWWIRDPRRVASWIGLLHDQASVEITDDRRFKQLIKGIGETIGEEPLNRFAIIGRQSMDIRTEIKQLLEELTTS